MGVQPARKKRTRVSSGPRELFTFRLRGDVLASLREISRCTGHTVGALMEFAAIEWANAVIAEASIEDAVAPPLPG